MSQPVLKRRRTERKGKGTYLGSELDLAGSTVREDKGTSVGSALDGLKVSLALVYRGREGHTLFKLLVLAAEDMSSLYLSARNLVGQLEIRRRRLVSLLLDGRARNTVTGSGSVGLDTFLISQRWSQSREG